MASQLSFTNRKKKHRTNNTPQKFQQPLLLLLQAATALGAATPAHFSSTPEADYAAAKADHEIEAETTTTAANAKTKAKRGMIVPNPNPNPPAGGGGGGGGGGPSVLWTCGRFGDSSHQRLREMHAVFNRLFGDARLTGTPNQCYVARCAGYHFSWCNMTVRTATEDANARNLVVGKDPGVGTSCMAAAKGDGFDEYKMYFWGKDVSVAPPDYRGGQVIRSC